MSLHDLHEDGSFKWLHRGSHASIATDGVKYRVDISNGEYCKAAPGMFTDKRKLLAMCETLECVARNDGQAAWAVPALDEAKLAIESISFVGEVA